MRFIKIVLAFSLAASIVGINATAARTRNFNHQKRVTKPICGTEVPMTETIKVIAEDQHAGVAEPFVAIAYDAETYARLRKLSPKMPEVSPDVFQKNAVIVAFLGQRPTGGFGINFVAGPGNTLAIIETKPAPGKMVMQVLSSPMKVVSVPQFGDRPLNVKFPALLSKVTLHYQVTTGEFADVGGIAGRQVKFQIKGEIAVTRLNEFVTLWFNLRDNVSRAPRLLNSVASGRVDPNGKFTVGYIHPGSFVQSPYAPLSAEGSLGPKVLTVRFESLPSTVADGFEGNGSLAAKLIRAD